MSFRINPNIILNAGSGLERGINTGLNIARLREERDANRRRNRLLDIQADEAERTIDARNRLSEMIGRREQPHQADLFPGEQPIPGIMDEGTGYLGGKRNLNDVYGAMAQIPNMQQQGIDGLATLNTPKPAEYVFKNIGVDGGEQLAAINKNNPRQKPVMFGQPTVKKNDKSFENTKKLRDEFIKVTSEFPKINNSFGRIQASVEDPSAAGDMALIFNYMKMLDPGSTVREGEFATAQNAAGVDQRAISAYNRLLNGQRLSVTQRKDFFNRSKKLFSKSNALYNKRASEYKRLARSFNLDPAQVIINRSVVDDIDLDSGNTRQDNMLSENPSIEDLIKYYDQ